MDRYPLLQYTQPEKIAQIHQAGVDILERVGVKIDDAAIRSLLCDSGCKAEGNKVFYSPELIEKATRALPKSVTLKNAEGKDVILERGHMLVHSSGAIPIFCDPGSRQFRKSTMADLVKASQLMDSLSELDIPCPFVSPNDALPAINQLRQHEVLLRHTRKPIYGSGISTPKQAQYLVELLRVCNDNISDSRPRGIVGISPESPLHLPKDITDTLKIFVDAGLPVSVLTAPVAGFSSPLTLAGINAQVHAEILATTVIAYLFNPDAKILYGARACFSNMKTGNSIWGLPEVGISGAVAVQLAHHCGYQSDVYGSSGTSCTHDAQQGYEKAINALLPALAGAETISGMGSMSSLMTGTLAQLAIDNEMFRMIRKVLRGFEVNEDTLAVDVTAECADQSNFIEEMHTLDHVRAGEIFMPDMAFAGTYSQWEAEGSRDIHCLAEERVEALLTKAEPTVLSDEMSKEFDRIIEAATKEMS